MELSGKLKLCKETIQSLDDDLNLADVFVAGLGTRLISVCDRHTCTIPVTHQCTTRPGDSPDTVRF
jgi:hypothetical protein